MEDSFALNHYHNFLSHKSQKGSSELITNKTSKVLLVFELNLAFKTLIIY